MAFSDHASRDASALLARLLASQSERSVKQLRMLRDAIDSAAKNVEATLAQTPPLDDEIRALVQRLSAAADADVKATAERIQKEAKTAIEAARADADGARAQVDTARKHIETITKQAEALSKQAEASHNQADAATKQADALKKELESVRKETDAAKKEVDAARKQAEGSRTQLDAVRTELEAIRKEAETMRHADAGTRAALEDELQEVRALLDATLAESAELTRRLQLEAEEREKLTDDHDKLAKELTVAQTQVQAAQTQRQSMNAMLKASNARVQTLERMQAEVEKATHELKAQLDAARAAGSKASADAERDGEQSAAARAEIETLQNELGAYGSLFNSLRDAFQQLESAGTISNVLTGLVRQLGTQFSRVAVFRVKGNRLEGEHQIGFDSRTDITNVAIPMSIDSLLTRAATSGQAERLTGAQLADSNGTPFGGRPSCALALPIVVNSEALAIVYADDSGQTANGAIESRTAFAELLQHHAIALLMRLTSELKTLTELREYATTLLNEVEHMFVADVDAGRRDGELRARLKDNLECARRIYAQRVQVEGPAAASLLDERLAALIEAQHGTSLGRELGAIVGQKQAPGKRRTAEAS